jgi:hypothetical protein
MEHEPVSQMKVWDILPRFPLAFWTRSSVSEAHILPKGWNYFLSNSTSDRDKLLCGKWSQGMSGLLLKPWTIEFDMECELVSQMKVWDILIGLLLAFKTRASLEAIGENIGSFVGLEPNWASKKYRHWAWIQVVGDDLDVVNIANFHDKMLVGRFTGKTHVPRDLLSWLENTWSLVLGYVPEAHILPKGWNYFLCNSTSDRDKLLCGKWLCGISGLLLKPWTIEFDMEHEPVSQMKVWDMLPGLPMAFWTREYLEEIGKNLGSFGGLEPNWASKKDMH